MSGTKVISKVRGALQDLLLGVGTTTQTRQGEIVSVTKVGIAPIVGSIAELSSLDTDCQFAQVAVPVLMHYRYVPSSTEPAAGYTVVMPSSGEGRWHRVYTEKPSHNIIVDRLAGDVIRHSYGDLGITDVSYSPIDVNRFSLTFEGLNVPEVFLLCSITSELADTKTNGVVFSWNSPTQLVVYHELSASADDFSLHISLTQTSGFV